MTFGQFIRRKRREAELSQQALADALGFEHRSHIHRLELGKIEWKLNHLFELARLFNTTPDGLIKEFCDNAQS